MLINLEYDHAPIPATDSDDGQNLADHLYRIYQNWRDESSELRGKLWPAYDRAFLAIRTLPKAPGFHWIDRSDQGETDLWDVVRLIVEGTLLSLMPRDMSWVSVVPFEAESQTVSNLIRDYLMSKHKACGTRQHYYRHLTQMLVRGTSAIHWSWMKSHGMRRLGIAEQLVASLTPQLDEARGQLGELLNIDGSTISPMDLIDPGMIDAIDQADRQPFLQYDGPLIRCLDMQDVYLDPTCNSSQDTDIPMAYMLFKPLHELYAARDAKGQPFYTNLEGLEERTLSEIRNEFGSQDTAKYLGISYGAGQNTGSKFIPVLVFHRGVQTFEDKTWLDTYFYVAIGPGGKPRLICAQENPLDSGRRAVYIDTYHDHYNNTAYGISAIDKSLPAWNHKCVVSALTLNAQVGCVYPAMNVISGLMVDEKNPTNAPGSYNLISYKPQIGPNFMAPVPTPNAGTMLGMQAQQFLGQKILGQTGALGGALGNDPSRNIEQSKTATQIDAEGSSTSIGRDNQLEKITLSSLEPMCQAIMEAAYQFSTEDVIHFVVDAGGQAVMQTLQKMELGKKRQLVVTGYHGLQQKNKEIENITKALQAIGQGNGMQYLGAGGPLLLRELMLKLLGRFGVIDTDKYKLPDIELIQQTPGGQQFIAGIQQETAMQVLQIVGIPPEQGAQIIQILAQQQQQQPQAGQQPSQQPPQAA